MKREKWTMRLGRVVPEANRPIASIRHGYLWIGGENGPCRVAITGRQTLRRMARMILRRLC